MPDPQPARPAATDGPPRDLEALLGSLPACRRHGPGGPVPITGLAAHTLQVRNGSLFACIPGSEQDGHRFAPAAVAAGAAALLVERFLPELADVPQAEVADVRGALAGLARAFHGHPDRRLQILAVTGTNGKTTTAFMLQAILAAAGRPAALFGTVCYRLPGRELPAPLTTPDAVTLQALLAEAAAAGAAAAVLEASSHALAQQRLEGLEVDTAIFTNLTQDHLDYHGTPMAYLAAKRRLFEARGGCKPHPALAVICSDGAAGRLIARRVAGREVVRFGFGPRAEVWGRYRPDGAGGALAVRGPWGRGELRLPLPGAHNAQNALAALAAALANGIPLETAARALQHLPPVPGRFEPIEAGQDFRVVVDFAHNPDGLRQALWTARRQCGGGTLRLVFGCKGDDGDGGKRRRMGQIAARLADAVYLTTDDPHREDPARIAAQVELGLGDGGARYCRLLDRRAAIRQAVQDAEAGDFILVAGRGHERHQPTVLGRLPFDDRAECRQALLERPHAKPAAQLQLSAPG